MKKDRVSSESQSATLLRLRFGSDSILKYLLFDSDLDSVPKIWHYGSDL